MNMKALTGKKQILAATVALALVIGAVGFIGLSDDSDAEIQTVYISGTLDSFITGGANQEFIVNGDLTFINGAGITLNAGNALTVNEGCTMTLAEGSKFTINDGGKAYVNGTINVNGKQVLTMEAGSEMIVGSEKVAGTLNVNAEDTLDVKAGAILNIPGYLNVNVNGSATFTGDVNVSGNAAFYGTATGKVNLTAGAVVAVDSAKTALSLVLDIVDSATINVVNVAGSVDVTDKAGNKVNISNTKAVTITHVNNIIIAGNPVVSNVAESATIGITSGVAQIGDMTTSDVRIYIENGAELIVTGALKAEKDNGVPMIHGKGDLTVKLFASVITTDEDQPLVINTKTNPDAGLDFNGVTYVSEGLNYYVTIARAIADTMDKRPIEIDVFGDVVISEDLTIPDNVTLDLTEANSLTVTKDATVTIEKDIDGDGTGGNIKTTDTPVNVEGTIIIQDKEDSKLLKDEKVNADVTLVNGNELTYTNLQNALDTVTPGETISLRKDVALKDDLLIPEFVTLDLDGHKLYVDDANAAGETVTIKVQGLLDVTDANSAVDLATKGQLVIDDNNLENDYYPFVKFVESDPINMNKVKAAQFIMDEDGTGANNLFVLTSVLGTEANMEKIAGNVTVTYDFVDYTKDLNFTSAKEIGFSFEKEFTTDGNIDFGNNSAVFHDNVEADEIITSSSISIMKGVDATLVGNVTTDLKGYVNLVNARGCADNSMLMLYINDNGEVVFKGDIVQDVEGIDSSATFGGALTIIGQHVGDADVGVDFIIADGADLVVKPVQSVINGTPLNLYEIFSDLTVPADASIDFDGNGEPVAVVIDGNVVVNGEFGKQNGRLAVAIACEDKHTHELTIAENATAYVKALAVAGDINVAGTLDVVDLFTNTNLTVTGTGKILMTGDSPTIAVLKDMIEMFIGADIDTQLKTYLDNIDPALFPLVQDIYNAYQGENTPGAIIARNIDNSGTIETNVLVANGIIVNTKDVKAEIIGATGDITLGGNVPTFAIASMGNITIPEGANVEAAYVLALEAVDIDGTLVTPEMITIQELGNIIYTYLQTEIEGYLNSIDSAIRDEIIALYNAVKGYDVPSVILGASVDISGNNVEADVIAACLLPEHVENGIEGGYVNISGTVDSSFIASAIVTFDEEKNEYVFNGGTVDISGTVTTDFVGGKDVNISGTVDSVIVIAENAIDVTGTVTARDALVNQPNTKLEGSVIAKTLNVTKMIDSTIVDIENKVTVGADGEIITDLFLAHDLDLAGKLTVNGYDDPSIIYGIANIDGENGMMSVAGEMKIGTAKVINGGAIVTDATADVCVEKLYVGIAHEDIFETGKRDISAGTIGDMVILDTNGAAYVSANSNVGAGIKQFASTKFYNVNTNYQGKLWFTAYQNGSPEAINDVKAGENPYAYIDGWRYTATFPGQIVDNEVIGYPDAVYQNIRYDIYSITVVADPAIGGVYIENMPLSKSGNVFYMDSNMSYDSNKTSYAVSGNLNNAYKGTFADNVTMYVNGEIRENFDFVLPANGDNLQQIDIKISLGYDATGVPSDTGGLTLIETLLIIITAAIIVIGVVVIFRMLRS